MRKTALVATLTLLVLAFSTLRVRAIAIPNPVNPSFSNFETAISTIGGWVPAIGVLALLVSIVWGAITIETAGTSAENVKKGWAIIRAGITGFMLLVLTPTIVQLVGSIIGAGNLIT
jgi:hypothetical protein